MKYIITDNGNNNPDDLIKKVADHLGCDCCDILCLSGATVTEIEPTPANVQKQKDKADEVHRQADRVYAAQHPLQGDSTTPPLKGDATPSLKETLDKIDAKK